MKILKYFSVSLVLVLLGSCSDWLDVNVDPSNPTKVDPSLVFTAAEASAAITVGGDLHNTTGFFCQFWTQTPESTQYFDEDTYDLNTDDFDIFFNEYFTGALNDFQEVANKSVAAQNNQMEFASKLMKVYIYQVMLDFYDKVPYTEALDPNNLYPKWDDGSIVGPKLVEEIDNLLAMDLSVGKISGDILLDNDIDNWRKFAKTLQLRLMLRMSFVADYKDKIKALVTEGDLLEDFVAMTSFENTNNKRNPWFEVNVNRLSGGEFSSNHVASTTILDYMMDNGDERYKNLFLEAPNGGYLASYPGASKNGIRQIQNSEGTMVDVKPDDLCAVNYPFDRPCYLLIKPEVYFDKAEVYLRFFNDKASAKIEYDKGVEASFAMHKTEVGDLLKAANPYYFDVSATDEQCLEKIMVQKWLAYAHFSNAEAWAELRRSSYPNYSDVIASDASYITGTIAVPAENNINSASGDKFPRSMFYPDGEYSRNVNTPKQISDLAVKLWWDTRAQVENTVVQ